MTDKRLPSAGEPDALMRLAAGDSASVVSELTHAVALDPDDQTALLRLGAVLLAIGRAAEAQAALCRAVALAPDDVEARLLCADALARLKKHDEAAFQLVQARRLSPEDARVHRQLGVAFFDKGLFDKSLASLARAAELDPADPRAPFIMGLIHDQRRDPALAIGCYRRAVALDPASVDARCTLADALAAMGEIEEAIAELEQAQRLDRTATRIARNLEILRCAAAELQSRRLLGAEEHAIERSTLVQHGLFKRKGSVTRGENQAIRYAAALAELWIEYRAGRAARLTLVLPDPARAAAAPDDAFGVTLIGRDGASTRADYATAVTIAFLRDALGCTLTRASAIYGELLRDRAAVGGDTHISFCEIERGGDKLCALDVALRS